MSCERWFWVRADGTATRELTQFVDDTEVHKANAPGRYAPKTIITRQVVPGRPGAMTTNRRHDWRPFRLPLVAVEASVDLLRRVLTQLSQDMDPMDGPGTLRHVGTDGHTCEFYGVQTADLDPDVWLGSNRQAAQFCTLVFEADEPYFLREAVTDFAQGQDPTHWFGIGGSGNWISNPWVGGSSVLGDLVIDTDSDALVWPVWTAVGPGDGDFVFTNSRTGETFTLSTPALAAGQALVIDLRDGVKTITGPGGLNWFKHLGQRGLFPLYKGQNPVTLTMGGTTSASYIGWSFRPRRLAP